MYAKLALGLGHRRGAGKSFLAIRASNAAADHMPAEIAKT
jgi:hypothetical protein